MHNGCYHPTCVRYPSSVYLWVSSWYRQRQVWNQSIWSWSTRRPMGTIDRWVRHGGRGWRGSWAWTRRRCLTGTHMTRTIMESLSGVGSDAWWLVHTAAIHPGGNKIILLKHNKCVKCIFFFQIENQSKKYFFLQGGSYFISFNHHDFKYQPKYLNKTQFTEHEFSTQMKVRLNSLWKASGTTRHQGRRTFPELVQQTLNDLTQIWVHPKLQRTQQDKLNTWRKVRITSKTKLKYELTK